MKSLIETVQQTISPVVEGKQKMADHLTDLLENGSVDYKTVCVEFIAQSDESLLKSVMKMLELDEEE